MGGRVAGSFVVDRMRGAGIRLSPTAGLLVAAVRSGDILPFLYYHSLLWEARENRDFGGLLESIACDEDGMETRPRDGGRKSNNRSLTPPADDAGGFGMTALRQRQSQKRRRDAGATKGNGKGNGKAGRITAEAQRAQRESVAAEAMERLC
jgi:hypothetical protein